MLKDLGRPLNQRPRKKPNPNMKNHNAEILPFPVPNMPRLLRVASSGEIVRFMGITKSKFHDPNQPVTVRGLERKTFEVPYRDVTAATDDESLNFLKVWPEADWDFPKGN